MTHPPETAAENPSALEEIMIQSIPENRKIIRIDVNKNGRDGFEATTYSLNNRLRQYQKRADQGDVRAKYLARLIESAIEKGRFDTLSVAMELIQQGEALKPDIFLAACHHLHDLYGKEGVDHGEELLPEAEATPTIPQIQTRRGILQRLLGGLRGERK